MDWSHNAPPTCKVSLICCSIESFSQLLTTAMPPWAYFVLDYDLDSFVIIVTVASLKYLAILKEKESAAIPEPITKKSV